MSRSRVVPAALLLATSTLLLPTTPAVAADTGVIAGKVTDGSGSPLADVTVRARSDEGASFYASTSADGTYAVTALPASSYLVSFDATSDGYVREYYDDAIESEDATAIVVGTGTRSGINAALAPGGEIAGTVTDASGDPIEGVDVETTYGGRSVWGWTDETGAYRIKGLPTGSYRVEFSDSNETHLGEWYDDAESYGDATLVPVTAPATTSGIDAQLADGASFSGRVTNGAGDPLEGITVWAWNQGDGDNGYTETDENGDYAIRALGAGSYLIEFEDYEGVYNDEYYDDVQAEAQATVQVLAAGQAKSGINASLAPFVPAAPSVTSGPALSCECGGSYISDNPAYADFIVNAVTWEFTAYPQAQDHTYRVSSTPALPADAIDVWHSGDTGRFSIRPAGVTAGTTYSLVVQEMAGSTVVASSAPVSWTPQRVGAPTLLEIHDAAGQQLDVFGSNATGHLVAGATYTLHWTGAWADGADVWNGLNWRPAGGPGITLAVGGKSAAAWSTFTVPANLLGREVLLEFAGVAPGKLPVWFTTAWVPVLDGSGTTPLNLSAAAVSGTAKVGQVLAVTGGTSAAAPARTYRWRRDGVPISGATAATYRLVAADAGRRISVTVTGTRDGYATSSVTSPARAVAALNTRRPTAGGTALVGRRLTASKGTWIAPGHAFGYQWLRNGRVIRGATRTTYTLLRADRGTRITVRVTARRTGFPSVAAVSASRLVR